ncbi:hypothetical protein Tsubulata_030520 [Turnera subulata]|uniref:Uncharacterized protein n=1 Tax=Turnera subulata TaxID=218843 RepID=A0A9Q0GDX4_9ROSI|nr:hypothetical protein Tsubulata_030520 [Turnera subulata]
MASVTRLPYHRLTYEGWSNEIADDERAFSRIRNFSWSRKFSIRRRLRLRLRIPGLRRFFIRKRRRLVAKVKVSWCKTWKRLKNGQTYMNDLLGGNFLVLQVSSAPFSCENPFKVNGMGGIPPRYPPAKIG